MIRSTPPPQLCLSGIFEKSTYSNQIRTFRCNPSRPNQGELHWTPAPHDLV